MTHRHDAPSGAAHAQTERQLGEIIVAKNLLKLRFCIICHNEMTDEICCTCEAPTVLRTSA
jgi:hypothetical protein